MRIGLDPATAASAGRSPRRRGAARRPGRRAVRRARPSADGHELRVAAVAVPAGKRPSGTGSRGRPAVSAGAVETDQPGHARGRPAPTLDGVSASSTGRRPGGRASGSRRARVALGELQVGRQTAQAPTRRGLPGRGPVGRLGASSGCSAAGAGGGGPWRAGRYLGAGPRRRSSAGAASAAGIGVGRPSWPMATIVVPHRAQLAVAVGGRLPVDVDAHPQAGGAHALDLGVGDHHLALADGDREARSSRGRDHRMAGPAHAA
jgi:hypothetical protein